MVYDINRFEYINVFRIYLTQTLRELIDLLNLSIFVNLDNQALDVSSIYRFILLKCISFAFDYLYYTKNNLKCYKSFFKTNYLVYESDFNYLYFLS